jgi:hypothetical protein
VKYSSLAQERIKIEDLFIKSVVLSLLNRRRIQMGLRELAFDYPSLPYLSS